MSSYRLNLVLGTALALVLLLTWGLRPDPSRRRGNWPLSNMATTPRSGAYSPNPVLPGGQTLQPPPAGTVPFGSQPLHYQPTPEDAARAGRELTQPWPANAANLARGEQVFQTFCVVCHGAKGQGDGPVALRGFPPPPPLAGDAAKTMADGTMFHLLTYGRKNMPAYAPQIDVADRWKAILYVRQLQAAAGGTR